MTGKQLTFIAVIAALGIGGFFLYQNMDGWITRTAEKIAGNALGVEVNIGSIDVAWSDKKVTVNTLEIGNPPGYRKAHAMTAEQILIRLNTASRELIDFNDITVKGSVINAEVNENGMNLVDLKNLANRKEQKDSVGSEQVRVIVKRMVIDASVIQPSISFLDEPATPIHMPPLHFSNIGSGKGIDARSAIVQVLSKYLSSAERQVRQSGLLREVPGLNDAQKALDDAAKGIKKLFD